MKLSSTLLVQSLFGETSGPEELALQRMMVDKHELIDEYISLLEVCRELGQLSCSPSRTSVSIVLQYSRETSRNAEMAS